jgi:hypothetical protein
MRIIMILLALTAMTPTANASEDSFEVKACTNWAAQYGASYATYELSGNDLDRLLGGRMSENAALKCGENYKAAGRISKIVETEVKSRKRRIKSGLRGYDEKFLEERVCGKARFACQ